ncbi:MAG: hypothetical protein CSA85_00230 [Alphaproteobacteria bacterium]|nr:MAG: hypothetical protein CSA85_00230 [Alphaproteobacteria bacterium]
MKDITEGKCPFGFTADDGETSGQQASDGETGQRHMGMAKGLARDKLPELVKEPIAPGADGFPTGRCMCGSISFQIKRPVEMVFANHDAISRRRSGGVAMTVVTRASNTVFNGWGHLVHYPISSNENACFCRVCGTPVLTYFLAPEPMNGMAQLSAGALDSTEGLRLAADISTDEKPDFYTFEGDRRSISSEELKQMFAVRNG